jgi:small GTP-binding protein
MTTSKIKLALLGEGGVGKTTLAKSFKEGRFSNTSMTVAVEFHVKRIMAKGQPVVLQIWDLGGQEQFKKMGAFPTFVKGSQGFAACFDVTDLDTLDNLDEWVTLVPEGTPMLLVGLKADLLEAPFDKREIQPWMENYPFIDFYLTSAKDLSTVSQVFEKLAVSVLEVPEKPSPDHPEDAPQKRYLIRAEDTPKETRIPLQMH